MKHAKHLPAQRRQPNSATAGSPALTGWALSTTLHNLRMLMCAPVVGLVWLWTIETLADVFTGYEAHLAVYATKEATRLLITFPREAGLILFFGATLPLLLQARRARH